MIYKYNGLTKKRQQVAGSFSESAAEDFAAQVSRVFIWVIVSTGDDRYTWGWNDMDRIWTSIIEDGECAIF